MKPSSYSFEKELKGWSLPTLNFKPGFTRSLPLSLSPSMFVWFPLSPEEINKPGGHLTSSEVEKIAFVLWLSSLEEPWHPSRYKANHLIDDRVNGLTNPFRDHELKGSAGT